MPLPSAATPYQPDTPRTSLRANRTCRVPPPVPTGHAASLLLYQPDTPRPLSQVDQHRRARLLEINSLPSMSVGSRTDVAIKRPALAGAVALVCGLGLSDTLEVSRFTITVASQAPSLYNLSRFTSPPPFPLPRSPTVASPPPPGR